MSQPQSEKVLRGIITLLILLELSKSPKHGYELQKRLSQALGYSLPAGSIYVLLRSLAKRGYIRVIGVQSVRGRRVIKYELTENGRSFLKAHRQPLKIVERVLTQIISAVNQID
ncbi:MAG: PadR family transcriptional regulator [Thermoprotei archaeon]